MSEWISVKERLPKKRQIVDVWVVGDLLDVQFWCPPYRAAKSGRITDCRLEDGRWRVCGGLLHYIPLDVTHWRSLPDPPEAA